MSKSYKYIFGPVASRRLGLSLGLDIIPHKTCSYNCTYCQVGKTTDLTVERKEYVKPRLVLDELKSKIKEGLKADYITFSGSGEPTLNSKIGEMIHEIKKISKIPVAVLTNGSLLYLKEVRKDLMEADLVVPSLDAGSNDVFLKVNRPHPSIDFKKMVDGLITFRGEFKKPVYLEVLLVEGINAHDEEIKKIKEITSRIKPDKVQLNTVYRPTAEDDVFAVPVEKLKRIKGFFGPNAEIICSFSREKAKDVSSINQDQIIALLKRRPCTIDDMAKGLNAHEIEIVKVIGDLKQNDLIEREKRDGKMYYWWKS